MKDELESVQAQLVKIGCDPHTGRGPQDEEGTLGHFDLASPSYTRSLSAADPPKPSQLQEPDENHPA